MIRVVTSKEFEEDTKRRLVERESFRKDRLERQKMGEEFVTETVYLSYVSPADMERRLRGIASACNDKTARIWDSGSGQLLLTVFIYSNAVSVAFSPDGTRFATGGSDGVSKVWDTTTGELLETLPGHAGGVVRCTVQLGAGRQIVLGLGERRLQILHLLCGVLLESEGCYSHDQPCDTADRRELNIVLAVWISCAQAA